MWLICENLRGFMVMRPPLVLFMTLLGVFAVILLTVGHIVNKSDLRNPDKRVSVGSRFCHTSLYEEN